MTGHIIIFLIVAIVLLLIGVPVAATLGLSSILFFVVGRHSGHDRCSAPVLRMRCGSTDVYSIFYSGRRSDGQRRYCKASGKCM